MEVQLTPEQEAKLVQVAADKGRDPGALAQEVLEYYLENESRFFEAVRLGDAELDRGEYLASDEVKTRIERLLQS